MWSIAWGARVLAPRPVTAQSSLRPAGGGPRFLAPRLLLAAALALWATAAPATTADDLCPPDANPCIVDGTVRVDTASVIDVGQRQLLISDGASLSVDVGRMTLKSGRLTVESGGSLRALGSGSAGGGTIEVSASFISVAGRVEASGSPGGNVTLESTGELVITGLIDASSRNRSDDGGTLILRGASINLAGPVVANGGRDATGGEVDVTARGDVLVSRNIETSGGDGGVIAIAAGANGTGSLTISSSGRLVADALTELGIADTIDLTANGDGVVAGHIVMEGLVTASGIVNGSGGCISVAADGNILGMNSSARFAASGGRPNGDGGEMSVTTTVGRFETLAVIDLSGNTQAAGGDFTFDVAGMVSLGAPVFAAGGVRGGSIDGRSAGDISITNAITADGGEVGTATIDIEGCTILIDSAGALSSLGPDGSNRIVGRNLTVVRGTIRADNETGRNEIVYSTDRRRPVIFDTATIDPPVLQIADQNLQPCGNESSPTPTRTATRTAPPSPTLTRTPTRSPTRTRRPSGDCVGDCNEDRSVAVNELVLDVNIVMDRAATTMCVNADPDDSGGVTIDELIAAVDNALRGCVP